MDLLNRNNNETPHTLRDLNLILKTDKPLPPPFLRNEEKQYVNRELLHKVWIKIRHMEHRTEVSVLNRCKDRLPRNVCPHCEHLFYAADLLEETGTQYEYRCYYCGAILNILKA
jgi:hypothetical protein